MDDGNMTELLRTLPARKAPPGMDRRVLIAAEEALQGRTGIPAWQVALYAAAAAAVVLLSVVLILGPQQPTDRTQQKIAATAGHGRLSGEEVAARAALLELKLSRLRQLARLSENRARHFSELDALRKELEDITSEITDTKSHDEKPNGESFVPAKKGGKRYVEESGDCIYRVSARHGLHDAREG